MLWACCTCHVPTGLPSALMSEWRGFLDKCEGLRRGVDATTVAAMRNALRRSFVLCVCCCAVINFYGYPWTKQREAVLFSVKEGGRLIKVLMRRGCRLGEQLQGLESDFSCSRCGADSLESSRTFQSGINCQKRYAYKNKMRKTRDQIFLSFLLII